MSTRGSTEIGLKTKCSLLNLQTCRVCWIRLLPGFMSLPTLLSPCCRNIHVTLLTQRLKWMNFQCTSVYQWVWPHLWADTCAVSHARRVHGVGAHWRADDGERGRQAVHGRAQRADGRVKGAGGPHGRGAEQRWVHSPVGRGWAQGRRGHLARWVWLGKEKMTEFRRKNGLVCL